MRKFDKFLQSKTKILKNPTQTLQKNNSISQYETKNETIQKLLNPNTDKQQNQHNILQQNDKTVNKNKLQQIKINHQQINHQSISFKCGKKQVQNITKLQQIQQKLFRKLQSTQRQKQKIHEGKIAQKSEIYRISSQSQKKQKSQIVSFKSKPKNPNVKVSSFAQYSLSARQVQILKNIKEKEFIFYKNVKQQDIKPVVCTDQAAIKQKYKSKFFNSGYKIPQNSGQSNFIKKFVYGTGILPQKLVISSWNLNGIKKAVKKKFVFGYLKLSNPDIFCVQQIRIDYESYKQQPIIFEGYNSYWNFCKCSKGYSGVVVFSKYPPIRVIQDFPGNETLSQEGRVLTLQFQKFYLINTYLPCAGETMQRLQYKIKQYQPIFYSFVNQLSQDKQTVIAGDLNVARCQLDAYIYNGVHQRQAFHPLQKISFENFLKTGGWIDTFRAFHPDERKFSWWNIQLTGRNKNMGKRIDYYLVKQSFMKHIEDSDVLNHIWGSDHCPIQLKLNFKFSNLKQLQSKQQYYESHQVSKINSSNWLVNDISGKNNLNNDQNNIDFIEQSSQKSKS